MVDRRKWDHSWSTNRNIRRSFLDAASEPGKPPTSTASGQAKAFDAVADRVEGFMRVGSQTTIPRNDLHRIALDWASGESSGRKSHTTVIAKALCAFPWSWEAFDFMVQVLLDEDLWPMPWHHYERKIKAGEPLDDVKAKIFIQSARTAAGSIKRSKDRSFRAILSLGGWHLYTDSEVGAYFVHQLADRVDPKNPDTWPPLYPGDLSGIRDGLDGVYSRQGRYREPNPNLPYWAR